jgi:hypothetical protein
VRARGEPRGRPAQAAPDYKRVRGKRRRVRAVVLAALALAVAGAAAWAVGGVLPSVGGSAGPRSGPLTEDEVRQVADEFASAYGDEDVNALRATLARDVQRVLPSGVTNGRDAVAREYGRQFAAQATRSYDISDLKVGRGRAVRASGTYTVQREGRPPIHGDLVLGVVRENGRPKIALIAATPKD